MGHPHPIPYQGSKRRLAPRILATVAGREIDCLYEPFAGSAAITLAAASADAASHYVIGDSFTPLAALWGRALCKQREVADQYEALWTAQLEDEADHYLRTRAAFNHDGDPMKLLYLLARCVKNSPRFNRDGLFNQSADHRRRGMNPGKMRRQLEGASVLLRTTARVVCGDFEETIADAGRRDVVYLDPPWEGTSTGVDKRYHASLERERLVAALEALNRRDVPWLLSYDGRHGGKEYGRPLPTELEALRIELPAGRSAQATLSGRDVMTVESLYVSRRLATDAAARRSLRPLDLAA